MSDEPDVERGIWFQKGLAAAQATKEARTRGSAEDTRMMVGRSSEDSELHLKTVAEKGNQVDQATCLPRTTPLTSLVLARRLGTLPPSVTGIGMLKWENIDII